MSRGGHKHSKGFYIDRSITTLNIFGDDTNDNPVSTTAGALVVHNGDVGFNRNLRVRDTAHAAKFEGEIAQIFTEFQLNNGSQNDSYVLTTDADGIGNWKTPHWFTNQTPVVSDGPTDNIIWTTHNVGISTITPVEKLHVNTSVAGEGAQIGNLTLGNWTDNSDYGIITESSLKSDTSAYGMKLLNTGHTHVNGKEQFEIRINDITAIMVNNNRYVGIGTNNPQEQLHVTENVIIEGNLDVLGNTTTISTEVLTIEDNMIKLSNNNTSDIIDFGFYGLYIDNGVTKFSGLYRDASEHDNIYKLFTNLQTEPTSIVSTSDLAQLRLKGLETELGITFDPSSRINHEELIFSGGSEPSYTDQVWFKSDGKIGLGISEPTVNFEVLGDIVTNSNIGIGISNSTPNYSIDTNRTDAFRIPTGSIAQRPTPIKGLIRFNDETQLYEGYYDDGAGDIGWRSVGIVIDGDGDTYIQPELITDDDYIRIFTEGEEAVTITNQTTINAAVTSGVNNRNVGIGISTPYVKFQIEGTDAIKIPIGTTSERPITLENGLLRYNTSLQQYEGYSTKYNQWESLSKLIDGDRDTKIEIEETVDEDSIKIYTRNELRMVIKGDYINDVTEPRIGIGITSNDPLYPLEIRSDEAILIPTGSNATRPNGEYGLLRYNTQRGVYEGYGLNGQWNVLQDPVSDNDGDTTIFVETFTDEDKIRFTTDGVQRMIIDSNGFIGIGVSIPTKELDIYGDVRLTGNMDIGTDVVIEGNLTVNGTTVTNNVDTLTIEDPLIKLATNNGTDSVDIGFYGLYDGLGITKFTGLVRDATDGYYTLFSDLTTDPISNTVDFTGITRANLELNILDGNYIDFPNNDLRIRTTSGNVDKVIITSEPYVGINTNPSYPLHVVTPHIGNYMARFTNDLGSDIFIADDAGRALIMDTNVTSSNNNPALRLINDTFGQSNNAPLFQIMNNGKIGIHTSTPDNLLHIETSTVGEGINIGDSAGTTGRAFIGLWNNSTTYMSIGNVINTLNHITDYALRQGTSGDTIINAASSQNIEFRHNNDGTVTNTVYIDTSGNVGIGSSVPAAELDVVGNVQILENSATFAVTIDNDATSIDMAHNDGSGILVDSSTSYAYKATDGATTNFIATNLGRVGINTDTPDERLHVYTTVAGEGAKIGVVQIGNHITGVTEWATYAHSNVYDESDSYALRQNSFGKTELNSKSGQDICFKIDDDLRMKLDQDGNLGIGITEPTNKLDVLGNTRLDGDVVITGTLNFEGPFVETLTFQDNLLKLAGDNTTNVLDIGAYGRYEELGDTKFAGCFWDASDNVWRMFDDLEVEPGVTVDITATGYNHSKLVVGDQYIINNLGVGIENPSVAIDVDGVVRAENYITTSDERTKNVIDYADEKDSYDKIKQTDVFKYNLKKDETKRERTGFIAQQLEKVMPEATITTRMKIEGEEVDDFRGIDQYAIIANLTNALKYSINKIEKMENEIRNLKEEVISLKIKDSLNQL